MALASRTRVSNSEQKKVTSALSAGNEIATGTDIPEVEQVLYAEKD